MLSAHSFISGLVVCCPPIFVFCGKGYYSLGPCDHVICKSSFERYSKKKIVSDRKFYLENYKKNNTCYLKGSSSK